MRDSVFLNSYIFEIHNGYELMLNFKFVHVEWLSFMRLDNGLNLAYIVMQNGIQQNILCYERPLL